MNKVVFQVCLAAARAIVQRYRATVPKGTEYYNGGWGGGTEASDFWKKGGVTNRRWSVLPPGVATPGGNALSYLSTSFQKAPQAQSFLSGLLTRNNNTLFDSGKISTALDGVTPVNFTGYDNLKTMAERNPFTDDYETATSNKFDNTVSQAMARLSTGPDVVRGGTARNELAKGEALTRASLERTDEVRRV